MINNTLTWDSNTKYITKRANVRMRMLQKLVEFNVPEEDNIFILYIRSVLELNLLRKCPHQNRSRLPGRQKDMFPLNKDYQQDTRNKEKYEVIFATKGRLQKSAIPTCRSY